MKKLLSVIVITLALNFLVIAGGVGWLVGTHKIDREKVQAIKDVIFPKPVEAAPATQPTGGDPTTQPLLRLEDLLTKVSGRPATDQVEFIQQSFEAQMMQLDRRELDLKNLQRQVEVAKQALSKDRAAFDAEKKDLESREKQTTRLAEDKGFQDSLDRYMSLPPKQVKTIFMSMDDPTVMNYLQTMPPKTAAKIIKEFKDPTETARIKGIMERMRLAQAPTQ